MSPPDLDWQHQNLSKRSFVAVNQELFAKLIDLINDEAAAQFGESRILLTFGDVCALLNAEAGLRPGGYVNADHVHSLNEHGLLPLPSNIDFWVDGATAWDRPMSLNANLYYFFSYCSAVKNKAFKTIDSVRLYRGLFEQDFSANDQRIQAMMLAGVIHGYFEVGTYRSRTVPLRYLLDNYRAGTKLAKMMERTDYTRASNSILENRELNLQTGLSWADELS